MGLVTEKEAVQAELLAVSHPVAFLEGDMGTAPPVEDLHVALLEAQLRPSIHKVFSLLPQRPLTKPRSRTTPPPAAAAGDAVDAGSGTQGTADSSSSDTAADVLSQQQQQQQLYGGEVPGDILQLLPTYWDQQPELLAAVGGGEQLGSKALMRMLQASCWSEEFRDPASSQVGVYVCVRGSRYGFNACKQRSSKHSRGSFSWWGKQSIKVNSFKANLFWFFKEVMHYAAWVCVTR